MACSPSTSTQPQNSHYFFNMTTFGNFFYPYGYGYNTTLTTATVLPSHTLRYPNGDFYEGQTCQSGFGYPIPDGYGSMRYANGDTYTGYFSRGLKGGQGQAYTAATQRVYRGNFINGKEEGFAEISWASMEYGGRRYYTGNVLDGKRHGQGRHWETDSWGKVVVAEGQWVNDILQGPGSYAQTENGATTTYSGTFVDGILEGPGTYRSSVNNIAYQSQFYRGNVMNWGNVVQVA
jgi:hypothetical protein